MSSVSSKIESHSVASMADLSGYANATVASKTIDLSDSERLGDTGDLWVSKGKVANFIKEHGATILSGIGWVASMIAGTVFFSTIGAAILAPLIAGMVLNSAPLFIVGLFVIIIPLSVMGGV